MKNKISEKSVKKPTEFQKEIDLELRQVERYVFARRRFFIKLFWVILLTVVLYLLVKFI